MRPLDSTRSVLLRATRDLLKAKRDLLQNTYENMHHSERDAGLRV
jgi:hypothetical protein